MPIFPQWIYDINENDSRKKDKNAGLGLFEVSVEAQGVNSHTLMNVDKAVGNFCQVF